jgi:Terpene cyclase DEP1
MNIRPLQVFYGLLGIGGLLGTYYFNSQSGNMEGGYLEGWFANSAASSAAVDLLVVFAALCIFMFLEGRRLGMRFPYLYGILAVPTAIAFTFPMFLLVRDRHMQKHAARLAQVGTPRSIEGEL